jgi:cell division protein ZapE
VHATIYERYIAHVRKAHLEKDPAQIMIIRELDHLLGELMNYRLERKTSALGWLFAKRGHYIPRGLYIWGSVGRGKTMLMDLFYDLIPVERKRRVHFHAFMADVHKRIHEWRQLKKKGAVKGDDPIAPVADALAKDAWLLCFDEFVVSDIADAMILGRLFQALFARGIVVVATSNVEPSHLYEGGLNRALFLPFIQMLQDKMKVLKLDARTDFRLEKLSGSHVYHVPADDNARAVLDDLFMRLTGHERGEPFDLDVSGRMWTVPQASHHIARMSFADVCEAALGASDYLALAQHFHTVFIDDIPILPPEKRNEAKRFIILIDALYDRHVKLIASAAAKPHELYLGRDGREAFEFERTVSRLIEMQSADYLSLPHGPASSHASGDTSGLVET